MIPLRDHNPTTLTPYVNWAIVLANVIVFLMQLSATAGEHLGLMQYAMVPAELTTGRQVGPFPAVYPAWMTIFTSMFMHGGLLHIGSNMLYLIVFGNNIEDRLGHVRYLLFYIACGALAAWAQVMSNPSSNVPTLGASGAVAGVLGAYLILFPGARVACLVPLGIILTTLDVPAIIVLGFWIITQLLSASMGSGAQMGGGIAYWAHIGGFFSGIVMLALMGGLAGGIRRRYQGY